MDKSHIIKAGYAAFASFERPEHFTNPECCEECADHDTTLQGVDLVDMGPEQVGQPAWTPLPYLTAQALGYLMPRLLEMALNNEPNRDGDPFVIDFIQLLSGDSSRFKCYDHDQAKVIHNGLSFISTHMPNIIEQEGIANELHRAVQFWNTIETGK